MNKEKGGTVGLYAAVFDDWRANKKRFYSDFSTSCEIHGIRAGLEFTVDEPKITVVIHEWTKDCDRWLRDLLPSGTSQLSHLKKSAILLDWLCKMDPVTIEGPGLRASPTLGGENFQDGAGPLPNLMAYSPDDCVRFRDGGSEYLSWLFAYQVCEWFERERVDRQTPYISRITPDIEHDMVRFLKSGARNADAIFMILKALFVRD